MKILDFQKRLNNFVASERIDFTRNILALNGLYNQDYEIDCNIIDAFNEMLFDLDIKVCNNCGSIMIEGYCIDGGTEYYCDDECLFTDGYTKEQWEKEYTDDGDSYWTEWEVIDEKSYELINNVIKKYPELGVKPDKRYR